jgi:hypothetical protein
MIAGESDFTNYKLVKLFSHVLRASFDPTIYPKFAWKVWCC